MIGKSLAHYKVVGRLGQGGMGEVYVAEDTRLDRRVALKVLPAEMAEDPGRRARFEREARTVAALNHPNIVTLHSVEEAEGVHFITMELVEGQTLSELLTGEGLPLGRLLGIAIPLADAVACAHRAGITHRDLKPDNIMIDAEGRVRVLDFGLAKPTETAPFGTATGMATATAGVTEEGTILGTVAYMSPEQAEGKPVDARSDVFSLGTVLYEMTVGQRPFGGETSMSTLGAILKVEPTSVTSLNPSLPRHLGRIIRRCLAKDPERRYQSALDLRNELEELKTDIDSGVHAVDAQSMAAAPTRKRWPLALLGVIAALAIVAVFIVWNQGGKRSAISDTFEVEMTRLPLDASEWVVLSPDARYVALNPADGKGYRLEVAQVSTGSRVTILESPDAVVYAMRFSPDGEFIYYLREPFASGVRTLQRIPVLGGDPESLVYDVDTPVSFSPDGGRLAFVRWRAGGGAHLVVADADGDNERLLLDKKPGENLIAPAWSPDGRTVVVVAQADEREDLFLLAVSAQGGEERQISPGWASISGLSWSPGGSSLILTGKPERSDAQDQIWEVSYPGDEKRRITRDLNRYDGVTLSADGEALVTVQVDRQSWISVVEPGSGRAMERVTSGGSRRDGGGLVWTPDGRIVHCARVAGERNLWITNPETKQHRQLTRLGSCGGPRLTSDGRAIVFMASEGTTSKLWRTDLEGSTPVPLAHDNVLNLDLTPDDAWVVYFCGPGGNQGGAVCRVPLAGGESTRLSEQFPVAGWIGLSPDGDRAGIIFSENFITKLAIVPLDGGEPTILQPEKKDLDTGQFAPRAAWSPDGTALLCVMVDEGAANLWRLALDGSPAERLTDFVRSAEGEMAGIDGLELAPDGTVLISERRGGAAPTLVRRNVDTGDEEVVFRFPPEGDTAAWALSRDGRRLALQRTRFTSSVVLLRNFR